MNAGAVAGSKLFKDDLDRLFALELVAAEVARGTIECHAFCLLDTHYHMLCSTRSDEVLSVAMQQINRRYAVRFNQKHDRRGRLFSGPFHSEPILSERHMLEVIRYTALNPEPQIERAERHEWSSYPGLIGARKPYGFVDSAPILDAVGGGEGAVARIVELVKDGRARRRQAN